MAAMARVGLKAAVHIGTGTFYYALSDTVCSKVIAKAVIVQVANKRRS